MSLLDAWGKRLFDIVVSAILLVMTSPLWLLVAVAIRLTSPGPVLYKGRRIGKDGKPFLMYKFRSMRPVTDGMGPGITAVDDPRITPVGKVLRATKLDELPQFLNVLRGDMSLVGPRPEAPEFVTLYDKLQWQVLNVRPGITGPTQLAYRSEERLLQHENVEDHYRTHLMPLKLEIDLAYVRNRTFWGDVRLLLSTTARLFQR